MIPAHVKEYSQALINICVQGTPTQGGIYKNLGQNGGLSIRVTRYRPNVRCGEPGTAPLARDCRSVLNQMPTDGEQRRFAPRGDPVAEILTPKRFITPLRECVLEVDTPSGSDVGDWYKIWAAAIAVEVMCVEILEAAGVALGLGLFIPPFINKDTRY